MPSLSGSQKALMFAQFGVARFGATRFGYHSAKIFIAINGVHYATGKATATHVVQNLEIRDVLGAEPSTASFDASVFKPTEGQDVVITLGSKNTLTREFAGKILGVDHSYVGTPENYHRHVSAIDYTAALNRRKVRKHYTGTYTDVAKALASEFAPTWSTRYVEEGLPTIDGGITFTEKDLTQCFQQLAKRGGYEWKGDYLRRLHFGSNIEGDESAPQPLVVGLDTLKAFGFGRTWSQIITRANVEGGGSITLAEIAVGETMIPLLDISFMLPGGGYVVAGPQPPISYTGVVAGGGGSLVGPGAAPASAPTLVLAGGAGIDSGPHSYAVTFVTASGESIPSPLAAITVGNVSAPTSAPTIGTPSAGTGPDPGTHQWAVTFVTSAGETTASPLSAQTTTQTLAAAAAPTGAAAGSVGSGAPSGTYRYAVCNEVSDGGETEIVNTVDIVANSQNIQLNNLPDGPPQTTMRVLYRFKVGAGDVFREILRFPNDGTSSYLDGTSDATALTLPAAPTQVSGGTAHVRTVALTNIPIGGALVTSRKVYRTAAGGVQLKLLTTIANNTATTLTDTTLDSALGANVPTTNTATANQVSLSNIQIGPSGTTQRKIYRTAAGQAQLKLQQTIANNTATTATDSTADVSLGANVPSSDTSGLTQPTGQVIAGSTTLIVAGTNWASDTGGWAVIGNGEQAVRYTGKTGTALTGIPSSGAGSVTATVSYNSQITAPAMIVGIPATGTGSVQERIPRGGDVNIYVQVNDLDAQAVVSALLTSTDAGAHDGIIEESIQDRSIAYDECVKRGQALLAMRSAIDVRIQYVTKDRNTRAGQVVSINLGEPTNIVGDFLIQSVKISNFTPNIMPDRVVEAASDRFSFEQLLALIRAGVLQQRAA